MFRNILSFLRREFLNKSPKTKLEEHPISVVYYCLFSLFAATLHIWRPFTHPQPEDAPCRGDTDPLIAVYCSYKREVKSLKAQNATYRINVTP